MATNTKDFGGIIQSVYEPTSQSLQVSIIGSGSPSLPNVVRLADGTNYITTTNVGGKTALDVNIASAIEMIITDADDSVKIGNGSGTYMAVNNDGSVNNININSLVPAAYDSIYPTYPSGTVEVYTYKKSGSTIATVTVTYTDSSKLVLSSVVRS